MISMSRSSRASARTSSNILKYLIQHYTDLTWDAASSATSRTSWRPSRPTSRSWSRRTSIQVLQEIAFQARCALWISNGVFYFEVPAGGADAGRHDHRERHRCRAGRRGGTDATEDIVTKMKIKWRLSWADLSPTRRRTRPRRRSSSGTTSTKYGTQEQELRLLHLQPAGHHLQVATFWLIRKSNTWKRIKFKTLAQAEPGDVRCRDAELRQPLRGQRSRAGGGGEGQLQLGGQLRRLRVPGARSGGHDGEVPLFLAGGLAAVRDLAACRRDRGRLCWRWRHRRGATGSLPVGDTSSIPASSIIFVGGPNVVFKSQSDVGDRKPTDAGFVAQPVVDSSTYINLSPGSPRLNLKTYA